VIEATELIAPHFKQRGGGRIINICSLGGRSAVPHMLPYNASKFALAGYSQGAAIELEKDDILVTTVYPALMQTGSPIQAVFKGEHEKEFAWFEAADNFPGLSMSPDTAARKILHASSVGSTELVLSIVGKARVVAGALFPEVVHFVMTLLSRLMPAGNSEMRRTGYQSRAHFEKSILTRPFMMRARAAEVRYNQSPSEDAEFNMGLN
jgi:short-subunit dehydrogenase